MTQDIDVVIDPAQTERVRESFLTSLDHSDFLFNPDTVHKAIREGGMFQLLDQSEALKLDVYVREMIAGELDRSERMEVFAGHWLPVVSRVDAALSKLIWIHKGSHKSRSDLRAIYRNASVDQQQQIGEAANEIELSELLLQVLAEANELE
jgi:hypothetical protein